MTLKLTRDVYNVCKDIICSTSDAVIDNKITTLNVSDILYICEYVFHLENKNKELQKQLDFQYSDKFLRIKRILEEK